MVCRLFVATVLFCALGFSFARQDTGQAQKETDPANSPDAAVILDSGSTNTSGYRLIVRASGKAEWSLFRRRGAQNCGSKNGNLPPDLTQKFFQDLHSLAPLSKLPFQRCMKSASFGHTLRVTYEGASSPDLTCPPAADETAKLRDEVGRIIDSLGIRESVGGFPPGCQHPIIITKPPQ